MPSCVFCVDEALLLWVTSLLTEVALALVVPDPFAFHAHYLHLFRTAQELCVLSIGLGALAEA